MSQIDALLSHLSKVRRTGEGRYMACCPAHDDRSPSMTIRDVGDGRILIHCFSGCSTEEILGAIGMDFTDLFPERLPDAGAIRKPWNAQDILDAVGHELTVVTCGMADLVRGKKLSRDDYKRVLVAINRVQTARDMACQ